jgi:1,4-dihydroxy-2-naphthoate octaprenyltransferase
MLRAFWVLARPAGALPIALLPIVGFAFAFWDHGCLAPWDFGLSRIAILALLWIVPHAGTMWLNAALDRDEGPVLLGRAVPVPVGIEWAAYPTLLAPVVAALALDVGLGLCVSGCAILSVLYSHPRTAWKGHALLGPFSNALGYGVLSPLGGFLFAGAPASLRGALTLAVSVLFLLTAYLAAQAFQESEDRARGYRTLVALRGGSYVVRATRILFALSALATLALAVVGYYPRSVLMAAPLFVWGERHLARWSERVTSDSGPAVRLFKVLLAAGVVSVSAVMLDFEWSARTGGPLGGLGTAYGHPDPRRCPDLR